MAARQQQFPTLGKDSDGNTIIDRALATATKNRVGIPRGEAASDKPVGKTVSRAKREATSRPAAPKSVAAQVSAAKERDSEISAALMKAQSMVPQGTRHSGLMSGLLGGASVGMDIQSALREYQANKKRETAAAAAMKMNQAPIAAGIGTPSNVPF